MGKPFVVILASVLVVRAAPPRPAEVTVRRRTADHTTSCGEASDGDEIVFDCGSDLISAVDFASYGQPRGRCSEDNLEINEACHFAQSVTSLEDRCLGQATCLFTVTSSAFGGSPRCRAGDARRWFAATLACGETSTSGRGGANAADGLGMGWQFNIFVLIM